MSSGADNSTSKKDRWDKFGVISGALGAIGVRMIIMVVGFDINSSLKDKETNTKLIDIAIQILSRNPTTVQDDPIRIWAIEVVDRYSDVKMGPKLRETLAQKPIIDYEWHEVFVGRCPNQHVAVFFGDHDTDYLGKAQKDVEFITDKSRCILVPSGQDKNTLDEMKDKVEKVHTRDETKAIFVNEYLLYKPCRSFDFYMYMPGYTSVHGQEKRNYNGGKICIASFAPA